MKPKFVKLLAASSKRWVSFLTDYKFARRLFHSSLASFKVSEADAINVAEAAARHLTLHALT